jgi:hypothetical protein
MIDAIAQQPILAALIALVGLGILFGALLGFAAEKFKVEGMSEPSPISVKMNASAAPNASRPAR